MDMDMDMEMKYMVAKAWIAHIITESYTEGTNPMFWDPKYRGALDMVINDFNMKLQYEKPKK